MFVISSCVETFRASGKLREHVPRAAQCSLHWQTEGLWRHLVCLLLCSSNCMSVFISLPTLLNVSYIQLCSKKKKKKLKLQHFTNLNKARVLQWNPLHGHDVGECEQIENNNIYSPLTHACHSYFSLDWKLGGSVPHSSAQTGITYLFGEPLVPKIMETSPGTRLSSWLKLHKMSLSSLLIICL